MSKKTTIKKKEKTTIKKAPVKKAVVKRKVSTKKKTPTKKREIRIYKEVSTEILERKKNGLSNQLTDIIMEEQEKVLTKKQQTEKVKLLKQLKGIREELKRRHKEPNKQRKKRLETEQYIKQIRNCNSKEKRGKGQPLLFKSEEQLKEKIIEYFKWRDSIGKQPTITSLATYLETSRRTLLNYEKKEDYFHTIKTTKKIIEQLAEDKLVEGRNIGGIIFSLTNNFTNWKNPRYAKGEVKDIPKIEFLIAEEPKKKRKGK